MRWPATPAAGSSGRCSPSVPDLDALPPDAAARIAHAAAEVAWLAAAGGSPRARARFGPAVASDLGVDQPWAVDVMAPLGWPSEPADLEAAVAWCRRQASGRPWGITCPRPGAGALRRHGLVERDAVPVLALPSPAASRLDPALATGLRLDVSPSLAAVVAAYGGWMQDHGLAAALVHAGDLRNPARRFVVVGDGVRPVGCALVWLAAGTVAVSGLGVVPGWRGRGVGAALVAAASHLGLRADPSAPFVWMHATDEGARLYRRLGFEAVDEHVTLGPAS